MEGKGARVANAIVSQKANIKEYAKESYFQEAWQSMRFDRSKLLTLDQQKLRIHHPGVLNHDQGPDFLNARIQIGRHHHHGHVELHLDSDDWRRHGHHLDPHYNAVVLHVFLRAGRHPCIRADGNAIPGLCLGDRIGPLQASHAGAGLACGGLGRLHLPPAPLDWLEAAGMRRLVEKQQQMQAWLAANRWDWTQLIWEELAAALGGPVNGANFRQLARQVPWSLARRYNYSHPGLEALLFGSCGMLAGRMADDYQSELQGHWHFLQSKHNLQARPIPFKFHRMHPAGFPTLRIAQLASVTLQYRPILQMLELHAMRHFLLGADPEENDYWARRHEFGNVTHSKPSGLGVDARARIITNVLVPMAMAYSATHHHKPPDAGFAELLRTLPAEHNKVTRKFSALGLASHNTLQSQGMIDIYRGFCSQYHCLRCPIGQSILGKAAAGDHHEMPVGDAAEDREPAHLPILERAGPP